MNRAELVYARVSDLARAFVGWATLEPRPYIPHYGPAEIQHEIQQKLYAEYPIAENLLRTLKFIQRKTSNIVVKGVFDGVRIIHDYRTGEDKVSLLEFKTALNRVSDTLVDMASFQLQLYIWIVKPYLEQRGISLHKWHYVEVINRTTGELMERIEVKEDADIEEKIWQLISEKDGISVSPFFSQSP